MSWIYYTLDICPSQFDFMSGLALQRKCVLLAVKMDNLYYIDKFCRKMLTKYSLFIIIPLA
jgi:hypothetical protein